MCLQLLQVLPHLVAFLRAPLTQGAGKARIDDAVAAAHQGWQEAAGDLVAALRAWFEVVRPSRRQ